MAKGLTFDPSLLEEATKRHKSTKSIRTDSNDRETVQVPLDLIDPYTDPDGRSQPFQMYNEEEMAQMVESVKEMGVLTPVLLRPMGKRYQTLAGHNRIEAAKQAGLTTVPAVIRPCDDNDAAIAVVDTNLQQRLHLLPSERARAYKVKMDAVGRKQGMRSDLNGGARQDTAQEIAEQANESKRNIFRYLLLNKLIPELLRRVDTKVISVEAGGILSELTDETQRQLEEVLLQEQVRKVSRDQATDLVQHAKNHTLTSRQMRVCLNCIKEPKPTMLTIKICVDEKLSPNEYKHLKKRVKDRQDQEDFACRLLEWLKKELMK